LPGIERVDQIVLLGVRMTSTLSAAVHGNFSLSQANQRLNLLSQLQRQGLCGDAFKILFTSLILSKLLYAIPPFAGQLSADDRNRYDALGRKAVKRELITDGFSINDLIDFQDGQLFTQTLNDCHCLHHLLPAKTDTRYNLRTRGHQYSLPDVNFKMFKNSFVKGPLQRKQSNA